MRTHFEGTWCVVYKLLLYDEPVGLITRALSVLMLAQDQVLLHTDGGNFFLISVLALTIVILPVHSLGLAQKAINTLMNELLVCSKQRGILLLYLGVGYLLP